MKHYNVIKKHILEDFNTYRFLDLEVQYKCMPKDDYIIFWLPETYSEDDFLIYIQDMFFNELPASDSNANDFFGVNANNIYDVYFKYDVYEKNATRLRNNSETFFNWDPNLDNAHNENDENFTYVKIKGLKYIIKFDKFDINDNSNEDAKKNLIKIFKNIENYNNKFKLKLQLDDKNITYKE